MPYYSDINNGKRPRQEKRQDAEGRGGFEDEGTRYAGNRGRGNRPAGAPRPQGGPNAPRTPGAPGSARPQGGFAGARPQGGRGGRPAEGRPQGNRPDSRRFDDRPQGNRPDSRRFDDRPQGNRPDSRRFDDRPQGNRPDSRRFDDRPQGNRPDSRRFEDRPQSSRPDSRRFEDRPQGGRPQGNRRSGGRFGNNSDFRFTTSEQQPYRERGSGFSPRSYDEQRRDRKEYSTYRYEAPERMPRPVYDAPSDGEEELVPNENLLSGRNPIREALKSGRDIEKMLVARGDLSGSAREILAMAKEQHVPIQEVDRSRLDAITPNHQGMLAFASAYQYHTVDEMLALAEERGEAPFLVVLDGVTDPHNLGAVIRTAECAGAHGVIVQERRAVGLTPAAVKASAGAIEHIMVARVTNLVNTLSDLKQHNVWAYAADMGGEDYASVDFSGGVALVIGAEGEGVSRLVLQNCDKKVSLPMRGQLDSLNASVAAGILLYAVLRTR